MILTFKPQFVEPIKAGTKIHTIREDKNRRWKPEMKIQFWNGNPRNVKAKPHQFESGICTDVKEIIFDFVHSEILILQSKNSDRLIFNGITDLNEFSRNDGFEDWQSLKQWFIDQYGVKHYFGGYLIYFKLDGTR